MKLTDMLGMTTKNRQDPTLPVADIQLSTVLGTFTKLQTQLDTFAKQNQAKVQRLQSQLEHASKEQSKAEKIKQNLSALLAE